MTLPVRVRRAAARRGARADLHPGEVLAAQPGNNTLYAVVAPGALTQREDLFLGIWKTAPGFEYPGAVFPL